MAIKNYVGGAIIGNNKNQVVASAALLTNYCWRGVLVIHGLDGRILEERKI